MICTAIIDQIESCADVEAAGYRCNGTRPYANSSAVVHRRRRGSVLSSKIIWMLQKNQKASEQKK
jgi:hypothetical protein